MTDNNVINRDSPDDSRTGVSISVFPTFQQDRSAVRTATVTSGSPDDGRGADLAIFAGIWTHSSHLSAPTGTWIKFNRSYRASRTGKCETRLRN